MVEVRQANREKERGKDRQVEVGRMGLGLGENLDRLLGQAW